MTRKKPLQNRVVVITAGPTREALDPVRFLTNASSGRMGYALAKAAKESGARVILISGPTQISPPTGVRLIPVTSAREMLQASLRHALKADIFIGSAAVADWRPAKVHKTKMKKNSADTMSLRLTKNPDILKNLSEKKHKNRPMLIGFALETNNLLANARKKMKEKSLDMIVANPASVIDRPKTDAYILRPGAALLHFSRLSKESLARRILFLAAESLS